MENLIGRTDGTFTQTALICEDGSHATLEHTSVYLGHKARTWSCPTNSTERQATTLNKEDRPRDFDLCTATCTTYCDKPVGSGGPNAEGTRSAASRFLYVPLKDCEALASYYANGGRFTIDSKKYIVWEYNTCRVTQYNRLYDNQKISYCFDQHHWAGVVNHIASHCGRNASSHGGRCYFYDSLHFCMSSSVP
ncbi:hypothetical protein M413DRAFT_23248 [Hebeloma cylindrosporum]|uniref:Uncharacterized protein n=1 Tax=Hebeloma cylindrosporum TaxID=76867 RepID=A0A0C3CSN4_HEBCY|nr:hypothetical protein M413DRAFT_23248 [Hebeloma cylindrosporum h7]